MGREGLGEFEHRVLLAILRLGSESYSVPIVLELEGRTGKPVAPAAVYIALRRLETRGLVSSRMAEPTAERGGRSKRYFRIEREAVRLLRQSRRALLGMWDGLEPVLDES